MAKTEQTKFFVLSLVIDLSLVERVAIFNTTKLAIARKYPLDILQYRIQSWLLYSDDIYLNDMVFSHAKRLSKKNRRHRGGNITVLCLPRGLDDSYVSSSPGVMCGFRFKDGVDAIQSKTGTYGYSTHEQLERIKYLIKNPKHWMNFSKKSIKELKAEYNEKRKILVDNPGYINGLDGFGKGPSLSLKARLRKFKEQKKVS